MSDAPAPVVTKRASRRRRVLLWAGSALFTFALLIGIALGAGALLLKDRPLKAPPWMQSRIEARIAQALPQARVSFGEMTLVIEEGWVPRVRLRDVQVKSLEGVEIIRLNEFKATFAAEPLLQGNVKPKQVSLSGIFAKLQRTKASQFRVSAGVDPVAPSRQAASLPQLIGQMDEVLQSPALSALTSVDLRALTLRYEDISAGKGWTVDGGRVRLARDGDALALSADLAVLSGGASAATLAANYSSRIGETAAKFGVTFDDVKAEDIAAQSPAFAWLDVLRAPIAGSVRSGLLPDGRFEQLNATLQIGAGVVQPNESTTPIPFEGLRSYFSYSPDKRLLRFDELSVQSAWFTGQVGGTAILGLTEDRRVLNDLVAQIELRDLSANPDNLYETPIDLSGADADFRVTFDPFAVNLGRLQINDQGRTLLLDGALRAEQDGWHLALDGRMDAVASKRVLALWPQRFVSKTRNWLTRNVLSGDVHDIDLALRLAPGQVPQSFVAFDYENASVKFMKHMPPVMDGQGHFSLSDNRLVVSMDAGHVRPPSGGVMQLAGSSFILPDVTVKDGPPAVIRLQARSSTTAALSVLNQKPLSVMDKAGMPVDLVDGQVKLAGTLALPLKRGTNLSQLNFHFDGDVTNASTDRLVKGRALRAKRLRIKADTQGVQVAGKGTLDGIPFKGTWSQPIGTGASKSTVRGQVTLSNEALDTVGVALPSGTVGGTAPARIALDLERGRAPRFSLDSQLRGIRLRVPQISWSKPANQKAALVVAGTLGKTPTIDTLNLSGAGLSAEGAVTLKPSGSLDRVSFYKLKVAQWLNAPVDIVGQGAGKPVQIALRGGSLDLRKMETSSSSGGAKRRSGPPSPPMQVRLDRLQITDTIALTDMQGSFGTSGGLDGTFQARLNGGTPVEGRVVPQGGRTAVKLVSADAGGVLRSAGLLKQIRGGQLQLVLLPVGSGGAFDGELSITSVRVQDAPGIAGLLNAVSVVGLINELNGDGIYFQEVDGKFRLTPNRITLTEGSAVGASMGLSMDGVYAVDSGQMAMQGVITPIYLLNGIGSVLTRKGEGVFGFNYKLTGAAKSPSVSVNPLSALAPGMFRDILRSTPRAAVTGTRNSATDGTKKPVARNVEER